VVKQKTGNLKLVPKLLGHSNLSTTADVYTHTSAKKVVERQVSEPGAGQVRIRVEACGICHTDAATVTGTYPGLKLPRVPGHEVVGRIEALGSGVSRWKIGQRVGVGLIAGEDGVCEPCRRGDTVNCQNPVASGVAAGRRICGSDDR
jgi:D-arabinose 1-dehydrogenase-like Zn-dependent alcohol dehydrogenase